MKVLSQFLINRIYIKNFTLLLKRKDQREKAGIVGNAIVKLTVLYT